MTDPTPRRKIDLSRISLSGDGAQSAEPAKDPETLASIVEAILFAAGEPLTTAQISRAIGGTSARAVREAVTRLGASYEERERAFEVVEIAGGYQLLSRREFAPYLRKARRQRDMKKLSPAAIETLAIIAYNPRIIRAEIESIRGVGCGPILRGLAERKLVRTAGRSDKLGSPLMYETTREFLDHFGLSSLRDLPKPTEFAPLRTAGAGGGESADEDGLEKEVQTGESGGGEG